MAQRHLDPVDPELAAGPILHRAKQDYENAGRWRRRPRAPRRFEKSGQKIQTSQPSVVSEFRAAPALVLRRGYPWKTQRAKMQRSCES